MQNYLINFVVQVILWMIFTFLFWQKNKLLFTIKLKILKGEYIFPICAMACSKLSQNVFTFSKRPKARVLTFLWEIIYNTLLTTKFFSFLRETLIRWHLNLFQFLFVDESMFNLFVSIKLNIQQFTLLIGKVTFQEKQYKIWFFFNNVWI